MLLLPDTRNYTSTLSPNRNLISFQKRLLKVVGCANGPETSLPHKGQAVKGLHKGWAPRSTISKFINLTFFILSVQSSFDDITFNMRRRPSLLLKICQNKPTTTTTTTLCIHSFLILPLSTLKVLKLKQLVRSIPRLSAQSCHLLGKIMLWEHSSLQYIYVYIQNGRPWWKSQVSCREECSHSIYFSQ